MRTQVMSEIAIDAPWLEHALRGESEKVVIESLPFTIGRNHSADFQIDSNQVSREHAVIVRQGKKYKVRDLGSTNGTFVNGERIDEATIGDGDILLIAHAELTFFCESSATTRQTATQIIGTATTKSPTQETVWDTIFAVRRAQEVATLRAVRTAFQPIIDLASSQPMGYEAFASAGAGDSPSPRCELLAAATECRANDRLRKLFRRLAVEDIGRLTQGGRLFLAVTAAESAAPWIAGHLCQLRESLDDRWQLVVEFPDSAVRSTAEFRSLLTSLRASHIQVAYDAYASGKAQITERKDVAPNYLKLAPSLVRSISRGKDRQRQVQLIVSASHEIDCEVIATGIDHEGDLKVCRDLGCTLAQGDLFGPVKPFNELASAANAKPQHCVTANELTRSAMIDPSKTREPIAGYIVKERIGVGGYGEVWSADAPGGLPKAMKFVYGYFDDERAARELKALNRIKEVRHPFLLSLERFEVVDGQLVVVTELADMSLKDRFEQVKNSGFIPREELLGYMRDAADGLDYLSEHYSLQHLDVKPENLLLVGGRVKVADFGLVKELQDHTASLMGGMTPIYAPPEVFDGRPTSFSDQYSLAIVYQEMLTGVLPFPGRTPAQLASQHLHARPRLTSLPAADQPIIAKALSKEPQARYPNCRALVEALTHPDRPQRTAARKADAKPTAADKSHTDTTSNKKVAGKSDTDFGGDKGRDSHGANESKTHVLGAGDQASWSKASESPLAAPEPVGPLIDLPALDAISTEAGIRPTLFVAIGGTGTRTLRHLRRRLRDRLGPFDAIPSLRMLLLDTDLTNVAHATQGDAETAIDHDHAVSLPLRNAHDYANDSRNILQWLSRRWLYNIPRSLHTEGRRPLGRLALVDHSQTVLGKLREALEAITSPQAIAASQAAGVTFRSQTPRVYIITSLCGGTGSGMVLDIAAAVRKVLADLAIPDDGVCGILTHSTDRHPTSGDLATANAYACLSELQHYHRQGSYPGDAAFDLPALPLNNDLFPQAYLVHLGERLSEEEFEQAVESLAHFVYLDAATPAGMTFERSRAEANKLEHSAGATLGTFGLVGVGNSQGSLVTQMTELVCRDVIDSWRGVVRETPAPVEGAFAMAAPAPPKPFAKVHAAVECQAAEHADALQLAIEPQCEFIKTLYEKHLGGDPVLVLATLRERMAAGRQEGDARQVIAAIKTLFGHADGEDNAARSSAPLPSSIERELKKLAAAKGAAIREAVLALIDVPGIRVGGALHAKNWYAALLRTLETDCVDQAAEVDAHIQALERAVIETEAATPQRGGVFGMRKVKRENSEIDSALVKLLRHRIEEAALNALRITVRQIASQVSATGDQLKDVQRELSRLADQFDDTLPWPSGDDEPAPPTTVVEAARAEMAESLRERLEKLVDVLGGQFQDGYLVAEGGLHKVCGRADAMEVSVPLRLRAMSRALVLGTLKETSIAGALIGADLSAETRGERMAWCMQAANPKLDGCGGARRLLAIVPEHSAEPPFLSALAELQPAATVLRDTDVELTFCNLVHHVTIPAAAARLVDNREDLIPAAARLHTRVDVTWQAMGTPAPFVPIIADSAPSAECLVTSAM